MACFSIMLDVKVQIIHPQPYLGRREHARLKMGHRKSIWMIFACFCSHVCYFFDLWVLSPIIIIIIIIIIIFDFESFGSPFKSAPKLHQFQGCDVEDPFLLWMPEQCETSNLSKQRRALKESDILVSQTECTLNSSWVV